MIRKNFLYSAIALTLFFSSCTKNMPEVTPENRQLMLTAKEQRKVLTDNSVGLKMMVALSQKTKEGENLFFSPLSISSALAMLSNGAKGETYQQIRNTLGFENLSLSEINAYYKKTMQRLPLLDNNTKINVANSVWYSAGLAVGPAFLQTSKDSFSAEVAALDFEDAHSIDIVNDWVKGKTNQMIPQIIDHIDASEVMLLINAVYFQGVWDTKFDKAKTRKDEFIVSGSKVVAVDMMSIEESFSMQQTADYIAIHVPYSNNKFEMVLVKPQDNSNIATIYKALASSASPILEGNLNKAKVKLFLPKFKVSYESSFKRTLQALGIDLAFQTTADFSGINEEAALRISDVRHKALITVSEEGTEASASTGVVLETTNLDPSVLELKFNSPFLFFIRERSSGLILFAGNINNPTMAKTIN